MTEQQIAKINTSENILIRLYWQLRRKDENSEVAKKLEDVIYGLMLIKRSGGAR